ncbi:ubiquinone biosynthesis monooxygenase COQ6-like protein [Dinothrombium tinctorium]|uniref:Ubiquinone biosynthesis monooxygenase COQ6-like protein n=1 Tax=Dinothrombium tinctorium TaxID=1965070 RepID=A0A3S3P9T9_9ACAR|nr:ubiquinone biosynthesis monooxygenase COQ6-like protein [Dinothrombium tinctorium]
MRLTLLKNKCKFNRFLINRRFLSEERAKSSNQQNERFSSTREPFDVVINGGGIVGLSFLAALRKSPFMNDKRVLLLEQASRPSIAANATLLENRERSLGNRVSSLTAASKQFFEAIDVWSQIKPFAKEIKAMHVWAHDFYNGISFYPSSPSVSDMFYSNAVKHESNVCYIVENKHVLNALSKTASSDCIRYESSSTEITENNEYIDIVVNGKDLLSTSLLVACDGFNSFVRQNCDVNYFDLDLQQSAIVGTIEVVNELENDENDVAYQRFIPETNSVFAILPLTRNYASFVLSIPSNTGERLMSLTDEEFVDTLNDALFSRLKVTNSSFIQSAVTNIDKVLNTFLPPSLRRSRAPRSNPPHISSLQPNSHAMFPLRFGTTLPYLVTSPKGGKNNKVVIIGDASHRIHPLAGQGLNLGLGDAQLLADCLLKDINALNKTL